MAEELDGAAFSRRLKGLLPRWGSKKVLAEKMGIKPQNLTPYLNGRIPETKEAASMADALGVNMKWLLTGKGEDAALAKPIKLRDVLARHLETLDGIAQTQKEMAASLKRLERGQRGGEGRPASKGRRGTADKAG